MIRPPRIALLLQRLVLRLSRTPARPLLLLAYRAVARALAAYLAWGERGAAVYARGGVGAGDFEPGLSDIDLLVVLADPPGARGKSAERVKRRWARLGRRLALEPLVDLPRVHEERELRELARSSTFTYGLDEERPGADHAAYFGPHSNLDLIRTLERPGLYGAADDWALLSGPDRRPSEPERDRDARLLAGWLELIWTWRAAFPFIADPSMPRTASACVKLIAEPARIWLWLAHGERASGRVDSLDRALRRIPEEEPALRRALELQGALTRLPTPPLAELLPPALRLSGRVAVAVADQIADAERTEVRLAGDPSELIVPAAPRGESSRRAGDERVMPLADWRAIVAPELPDEALAPVEGDPREPAVVARCAGRVEGPYPALSTEGLMILPALPLPRTRLRAMLSSISDPVPFAVAAGERVAAFAPVRGWSAVDTARRAVAEHRAWLEDRPEPSSGGRQLGRLLTAARAALFLESVEEGDPELCLTVAATTRRLAARSKATAAAVDEALGRYRGFALAGSRPPSAVVSAAREVVIALPAYAASRGR